MKIEDWIIKWHRPEDALPYYEGSQRACLILFRNAGEENMQLAHAVYKNKRWESVHEHSCRGLEVKVKTEFDDVLYWAEIPDNIKIEKD